MFSRQERVEIFMSRFRGGAKTVYDYRDKEVSLLEKMWKRRLAFYRKSEFVVTEGDNRDANPLIE